MDHFEHIHDKDLGLVKISDEVMAVCAINAVLKTSGVAGLFGGFTASLSETILGKESLSKGIKVNQTDEGIILDIFVIVKYGVKIPAVAWDIQTNVKNELETMTDHKVLTVNIHVQSVEAPVRKEP